MSSQTNPLSEPALASINTPLNLLATSDAAAINTVPTPANVGSSSSDSDTLKRKADDSMDDLVAKAKASRTEGKPDLKESINDVMERELTCGICCDILADPVTLLDCIHNFCGSCLVRWFENNSSCPSCRRRVRATRDTFTSKPLLDALLKEKPELARSEEELEELRKIYKPGQKIKINRNGEDYDEDDEYDDGEDEEDAEERFRLMNPYLWTPCPCCVPGANPLYACPAPLQPDADGNYTRNAQIEFQGHKMCRLCQKVVPYDPTNPALAKYSCGACKGAYCNDLYGPCNVSNYVRKIEDASLYTSQMNGHFGVAVINDFERNRLITWLSNNANNITLEEIGNRARDWLFNKYDSIPIQPIPGGGITIHRNSYACQSCLRDAYNKYIMDFLISERGQLGFVDNRTSCWYGKSCRTQWHNPDHCARLNHLCHQIPPESRRNDAPPRPAHPSQTGGVRGVVMPQQPQPYSAGVFAPVPIGALQNLATTSAADQSPATSPAASRASAYPPLSPGASSQPATPPDGPSAIDDTLSSSASDGASDTGDNPH